MNAAKILREHGISLPSYAAGRYYTMCPKCSAKRSKAHQNNEVLGVTIDDKGVQWGCNHCTWTGGAYYNGKANGHSHSAIVATYDYVDETGELLFQVCRKVDKSFPQRAPDGKGGWTWSTKDVHKVLYRLPEVIEAIASGHTILIPEGEKDANAAWKIGLPATCNPGGASEPGKKTKWRKEYSETLRDADVVIMPDHDAAGYAHADAVARSLSVIAKRVRILKLPDHWPEVEAKKGGDLSDGLAAGHTREQLDALIDAAPNYAAVQGNVSKGNEENADGEDAIALRFAEEHAENLRYVAMWSRWLSWNGKLWRFDDTLHAFDRARRICREAGESDAKTVAAVERLAKSDRRLAATIDQWDADPWRLNTPGGVVDLRTGKTHPARPRDYCTKITAVAPGGDCQTWLAFLHRVTGGMMN